MLLECKFDEMYFLFNLINILNVYIIGFEKYRFKVTDHFFKIIYD